MLVVVTGGSGSGKSAFAEDRVLSFGEARRIYIATMQAFDEESHRRIRRHRRMRAGKGFETIERYTELDELILPKNCVVLLECMSNLVANEMFREDGFHPEVSEKITEGVRNLLSQAEHDELASAILITTSKELAAKVSEKVDGFVKVLSRKEIIQKSLDNFGYILIAEDMDEAIEAANAIASEHMEIVTANPFEVMMKVRNAGAIFIGENSSEPLGDYFAGPNHVLPTNGTAKFFSALSVDDFVKKSSIVYYSREALRKIHKDIEQFATSEQLTAHANSIAVRFEDEEQ